MAAVHVCAWPVTDKLACASHITGFKASFSLHLHGCMACIQALKGHIELSAASYDSIQYILTRRTSSTCDTHRRSLLWLQGRVSWQANSLFPGDPHPSIVGDNTVRPTPLIPMEAAVMAKQSCTSQYLDVHSDGDEEEVCSAAAYCNHGGYLGSESGLSSLNDAGAYAVAESSHTSHPGIADLQEQLAAPSIPCQEQHQI